MKQLKIKIRLVFVFCAAFFVFLAAPDIVRACSCMASGTVDVEFAESPNVVVVKLQSVEKLAEGEKGYGYGGVKQSKLTVEKIFKGNLKVGDELTFAQGGGADCVWTFDADEIGTEYLFYLGAKPIKEKIWFAGTCSRSGSTKYRAADLLYLENLSKLRGKTRLSGAVIQSIETTVEAEESLYRRLAGRKIRITGNGKNIELKTDENGVYEIYDLPAGKYRITPEKISGFKFNDGKSDWIEVEVKAKSHTEQNFSFQINNRVTGRFFDRNGKPLKDVCIHLLPARGKAPKYFYQGDCTDADGKFGFDEIPAGTYVIVVNDDGEISADEPFGTFYYPSATQREDAAEITVGAGDFIDDLIISAPQTVEIVTVGGVLLFENGKPAADESIEFYAEGKNLESDDAEADSQAKTDEKGRFSIRILKGQKGKLFGSMLSFVGEYENCPKLDKIIRAKGNSVEDIKTPAIDIEANTDLNGVELKFPFPSCKKRKIE